REKPRAGEALQHKNLPHVRITHQQALVAASHQHVERRVGGVLGQVFDQRRGQDYVANKGGLDEQRGGGRSGHKQASKVACAGKSRVEAGDGAAQKNEHRHQSVVGCRKRGFRPGNALARGRRRAQSFAGCRDAQAGAGVKTEFNRHFLKDIGKLPTAELKNEVADIILAVESAASFSEIRNVKKLKGFKAAYRIRVGDFRI
nr:hypothetical protein [Tanacetum cinerariifolium]